jgi:serine/threonine protein kinase
LTFALGVSAAGLLSFREVQRSIIKNLESKLTTILETDVKALTIWTEEQKRIATFFAEQPEVRNSVLFLLESKPTTSPSSSEGETLGREAIHARFQLAHRLFGYVNFHIVDRRGRILACLENNQVGSALVASWTPLLQSLWNGQARLIKPSLSLTIGNEDVPSEGNSRPLLLVAAPIFDDSGSVVAAIVFGIPPEREFTQILSVARAGDTGETIAFDDAGWLLSDSRFDAQLRNRGLLQLKSDSGAVLKVQLKAPGDADGPQGTGAGIQQGVPLMELAASALQAKQSSDFGLHVDVNSSLDYRGVHVVGAYQWLPQYDFGVITKLDYREAYAPGLLLRNIFTALFLFAAFGVAFSLINTRRLARIQRRAMQAENQVQKLGQYTLLDKIGAGGMGEVYRASHAMLRRPTAVKLLRPERSSEAAIERFEQEVQLTSQLTHPNTIAIYDYGRTPEGVFYYAMEYLDGLNLSQVVKRDGPQHAGRVVQILRKVCNSLNEAHEAGLIHRDIKPENIILCRRGERADIVKVLDFGLVRELGEHRQAQRVEELSGTPAYMSPESFQAPDKVDVRSDIYAVGAVGYFLLTGSHVFEGKSIAQAFMQHTSQLPVSPQDRLGRKVDAELSALLLRCLYKEPIDRPQSAEELSRALSECSAASEWTRAHSSQWWESLDHHPKPLEPNTARSWAMETVTHGKVDLTRLVDAEAREG